MAEDSDIDTRTYIVVKNDQEQFSIWLNSKPELPVGWASVGVSGSRGECLDWIQQNWTDLRPESLRL